MSLTQVMDSIKCGRFVAVIFGIVFFPRQVVSFGNFIFYDPPLLCTEEFKPAYCGFPNVNLSTMQTLDDFDNCGPGKLSLDARNYFYGTAGRATTYMRNMGAFKNVAIIPRMLRDVSKVDLSTTLLGQKVSFPVGLSPTASHILAHPDAELASARASTTVGSVFILSSVSSMPIEDVAEAAKRLRGPDNQAPILWMQTYIYKNRDQVLSIIKKAEDNGFKAIVVTSDSPKVASSNCASKNVLDSLTFPNLFEGKFTQEIIDASVTFRDLHWLKRNTKLPVVAKGILTGDDAINAAKAGASAILVSNHGGRQLDSDPAAFDALPGVVEALKKNYPRVEVYVDGGVRSGYDVFKAMARGARAAFVGRPVVWSLAVAGQDGVEKMLTILKREFNETMILAGRSNVREIPSESQSTGTEPPIFATTTPALFTPAPPTFAPPSPQPPIPTTRRPGIIGILRLN